MATAVVLVPLKLDGTVHAVGDRITLTDAVLAALPLGTVQVAGQPRHVPEIPYMALSREDHEARARHPHPHARIDELAAHPPVTAPGAITLDPAMARHPGLDDESELAGAPGESVSQPPRTVTPAIALEPPPPPVGEKTRKARA